METVARVLSVRLNSGLDHLLPALLASLEIAYNVIAVDKQKNSIIMKPMEAKAMFVPILRSPV